VSPRSASTTWNRPSSASPRSTPRIRSRVWRSTTFRILTAFWTVWTARSRTRQRGRQGKTENMAIQQSYPAVDGVHAFKLPDVGEGLVEAELLTWYVGPGDEVTVNQMICEIETAKAVVELPSPHAGTVKELKAQEGETVEVGSVIITIDDGTGSGGGAPDGGTATAAAPEAPAEDGEEKEK